jgi:hypothetical protein
MVLSKATAQITIEKSRENAFMIIGDGDAESVSGIMRRELREAAITKQVNQPAVRVSSRSFPHNKNPTPPRERSKIGIKGVISNIWLTPNYERTGYCVTRCSIT